ncbi:amino acid transporter [Pochonia chlamydosporia 170]|uniref:Amino acid transporter n=1 Tax=Pochonia chlamydosporia 170 TaxID=1380566 RepID=A0A179F7K9_METCM|nr:amino acid transporter [Pochonia chlamydosporia 170]OAQ61465.1 amino acid transporter [Pochonia chlamydosporia 170]
MKFFQSRRDKKQWESQYEDEKQKYNDSLNREDVSPAREGVLVGEQEQAANIFSEGGKNYRTMGRWDTALVLASNQVGLGILSLPKILDVLGIVPSVITIIGFGVVSWYTAYELLQFYRRHPHVVNMVDMARVVGGVPFEIIFGICLLIKICFTCGSATITISIALNTLSNHGMCTVGFAGIAAIACWLLCLPRKFKFVAQVGLPSTISIIAAVLIVIISLGVSPPQNAPPGFDKNLKVVGNPSFSDGVNAVLKVCYAYAGNVGFVSYMAEMKNPGKDFVPALTVLQVFSVVLYVVIAVAIYCLSGQYTTSPALGSAPTIPAKVAYGIVLPAILSTGLVFGHTAIKYLYVVAMRAMKSTDQLTDRSFKSWGTWIACATLFWIVSFVIANAIPIFDSILSIASATFIAWFTFGISGVFWYHRNWQERFHRKNIPLAIINALLIAQALFMNGVGLWAAITQLIDIFNDKENKVGGVFPCADNSLF